MGLLAWTRANEIDIGFAEDPCRFSLSFKDNIVYDVREFEDHWCSDFTHSVVSVRYRDEKHDEKMGVSFAQEP